MKNVIVTVSLSAMLLLGGILVAQSAQAAAVPYLLVSTDSEAITPPIVTRHFPVILPKTNPALPTAAPSDTLRASALLDSEPGINVPMAAAQPADCIDPDISSNGYFIYDDPADAPITLTLCNKTYTRTTTSYIIVGIYSANVTLDCNGSIMVGNYDFSAPAPNPAYNKIGIFATGADNLTIKNCTIGGFGYGMYVGGGYDSFNHAPKPPMRVTLFNNTFTQSSYIDMVVSSVINSEIYNNVRLENSGNKSVLPTIDLEFASNSRIHDNTLFSNGGINLAFNSNYNQVYRNTLGKFPSSAASPNAIWINHGSAYNNIYNNTIIGPHEVWTGAGVTFDGDKDSDDFKNTGAAKFNTIHHNTIIDFWGPGINLLHDSHDNTVSYNTYTGVDWGVISGSGSTNGIFYNPHNNRIENNYMTVYTGTAFQSGTHDNVFIKNYINFIGDPEYVKPSYDMGTNNQYDENGVGNFWSMHNNPANGCDDTDRNSICDTSSPIYNFSTGEITNYDYSPVSAVPILQPISPIVVNELYPATVKLIAANPMNLPFQYSVNSPKFFQTNTCSGVQNTFAWPTNQFSSGNYSFTATVQHETYTSTQNFAVRVNDTCYINKFGKWSCAWPVQAVTECSAI
ncbi:MAG: right-handed parallel beta-helix repeat-containing protein [Patescibacteria group bacterium]